MFSANLPNNDADAMPKIKDQLFQWFERMKEYIRNQRYDLKGKNCLVDRQKLPRQAKVADGSKVGKSCPQVKISRQIFPIYILINRYNNLFYCNLCAKRKTIDESKEKKHKTSNK